MSSITTYVRSCSNVTVLLRSWVNTRYLISSVVRGTCWDTLGRQVVGRYSTSHARLVGVRHLAPLPDSSSGDPSRYKDRARYLAGRGAYSVPRTRWLFFQGCSGLCPTS